MGLWNSLSYFTDHQDPELAEMVSRGRQSEFVAFGWQPSDVPNPQDPETFEHSKLDWTEPGRAGHEDLLEWHRALIALRKRFAHAGGETRFEFDSGGEWLVLNRGPLRVACNFASVSRSVPAIGAETVMLAFPADVRISSGCVLLRPASVAVLGDSRDGAVRDYLRARERSAVSNS